MHKIIKHNTQERYTHVCMSAIKVDYSIDCRSRNSGVCKGKVLRIQLLDGREGENIMVLSKAYEAHTRSHTLRPTHLTYGKGVLM